MFSVRETEAINAKWSNRPVWQIVCMQITKRIAQDLIELNKMNISCRMRQIARLMTFALFD